MRDRTRSHGLSGFAVRHRAAVAWLLAFLIAAPPRPDDRQLLQANAGANTNVLSSSTPPTRWTTSSPTRSACRRTWTTSSTRRAPSPVEGSKLGVAKSVLRQVMTNAVGVNWAFAYYRNPNQTFGAAQTGPLRPGGRRRADRRAAARERRSRVALLRRLRSTDGSPISRRVRPWTSTPTSSRAASCSSATRSCTTTPRRSPRSRPERWRTSASPTVCPWACRA